MTTHTTSPSESVWRLQPIVLDILTAEHTRPDGGLFHLSIPTTHIVALLPSSVSASQLDRLVFAESDRPNDSPDSGSDSDSGIDRDPEVDRTFIPSLRTIIVDPSTLSASFREKYTHKWGSIGLSNGTSATPSSSYLYVVLSTQSGRCRARRLWNRVLKQLLLDVTGVEIVPLIENDITDLTEDKSLLHAGPHASVLFTSSITSILNLTEKTIGPRARAGIQQRIVLLSGDGGVADILNGLAGNLTVAASTTTTTTTTETSNTQNQITWQSPLVAGDGVPNGEGHPRFRAPEIGLLPLGTGNALANSAWIKSADGKRQVAEYHQSVAESAVVTMAQAVSDPTLGLSSLLRGIAADIPICQVSFPPGSALASTFLPDLESTSTAVTPISSTTPQSQSLLAAVVCSWGIHASLVANSDKPEYRVHGVQRFQMAATKLIFPSSPPGLPRPYAGTVLVKNHKSGDAPIDSEATWSTLPDNPNRHLYVATVLAPLLEKGYLISPGSLDSTSTSPLHIVRFGPMDSDNCMRIMLDGYQAGKHVHDPAVLYQPVEGVRVLIEGGESGGSTQDKVQEELALEGNVVCVDGRIVNVPPGHSVDCNLLHPELAEASSTGVGNRWIKLLTLEP